DGAGQRPGRAGPRRRGRLRRRGGQQQGCFMSQSDTLLEIRQLEVAYGGIRAVRGMDLEVRRGELVSLIGANGAGKSTTLRAICGLVPVAAGSIVYDGRPIAGTPS